MLRKSIVAIAAAAAIGTTMLTPTGASAGYAGDGFYGPHFAGGYGYAHYYGYRPFYGYGFGCWRWVPTRWGFAKVNVCSYYY